MNNQLVEVGYNAGPDDSKHAFYNLQRSNSIPPQHDTNSLFHIGKTTADLGFPMTMMVPPPACSPNDPTAQKLAAS